MGEPPFVLEVDHVSKHFARELRRSVRYAAMDIARELSARPAPPDGWPLRRGEFAALDSVSFTLNPGESLAVIGANGAGKSTLLKLLYGLIKPDRGEIRVRGRIAALIELGTGIDPVLTGRENVAVNGAILGMPASRMHEITEEIVAFAELEHAIDAPVRTYSSGMVARLAFAVAAHLEPEVLLIDEVLAVGDLSFQRKCVHRIHSFLERGGALVFVSHNTPQIQSTCQRGLLLENGRCTFDGDVVDVLNRYLAAEREAVTQTEATLPTSDPGPGRPVVIDAVTLRSESDDHIPRTGEPLHVEVAYRSLEATHVVWGFNIWTGDGWVCVTGAYDMRRARLQAGAGKLSCTIPALPLMAGRYLVKTAIVEADTLHAFALHGYEDVPASLVVESAPSAVNNGLSSISQLTTLEVSWD